MSSAASRASGPAGKAMIQWNSTGWSDGIADAWARANTVPTGHSRTPICHGVWGASRVIQLSEISVAGATAEIQSEPLSAAMPKPQPPQWLAAVTKASWELWGKRGYPSGFPRALILYIYIEYKAISYLWLSRFVCSLFDCQPSPLLPFLLHHEPAEVSDVEIDCQIHPRNLTWNLKISPWKRKVHLETIIFRFHVKFR